MVNRSGQEKIAYEPIINEESNKVNFKIKRSDMGDFNPSVGTSTRGDAKCPKCHQITNGKRIRELDKEGKINSAVCLLNEFKNILTIRSLSKTHGLASLRIGFGIGDNNLIKILEDHRLTFVMNGIAQKVAVIAFDDEKHLEKVRSITKLQRNQLEKEFQKISVW